MLAQSSDRRVVADSESTRMERGSNAMVVDDTGVSVTSGPFSATDAGGTAVLRASQSVQIAASAGEGATLSARSAAVSGGDVYVAAGSADPQEAEGGDTALQMGSGLCGPGFARMRGSRARAVESAVAMPSMSCQGHLAMPS